MTLDVSAVTDKDIAAVVDLWARAGLVRSWNDPREDIAFALSSGHAAVLVGRKPI